MKIYLPTNALTEDKAALEFIRGVLAGYSYAAQFVICDNPACVVATFGEQVNGLTASRTSFPRRSLMLTRRAWARQAADFLPDGHRSNKR